MTSRFRELNRYLPFVALSLATVCSDAHAASGSAIHDYIAERSAISNYMSSLVETIGRDLTNGRIQLNGVYDPTITNLYVVDGSRLDPERLESLGIPSIGDAIAIEDSAIVIIDERHLKELVVLSLLFWHHEWPMQRAMAELEIKGLRALGELWEPSLNPALVSDDVQYWRISFRGALGFLLSHELGHLKRRASEPASIRKKNIFRSVRDRDIHWACPELVDDRSAAHREIEAEADRYAVRLLQTHAGARSPGQYEIGAEWYFRVLLEQSFMKALGGIQDLDTKPELKRALQQRYGTRFSTLLARRRAEQRSRRGAVSEFYPRGHPSALARLSLSLDIDAETRQLAAAWAQRMERECASLAPQ